MKSFLLKTIVICSTQLIFNSNLLASTSNSNGSVNLPTPNKLTTESSKIENISTINENINSTTPTPLVPKTTDPKAQSIQNKNNETLEFLNEACNLIDAAKSAAIRQQRSLTKRYNMALQKKDLDYTELMLKQNPYLQHDLQSFERQILYGYHRIDSYKSLYEVYKNNPKNEKACLRWLELTELVRLLKEKSVKPSTFGLMFNYVKFGCSDDIQNTQSNNIQDNITQNKKSFLENTRIVIDAISDFNDEKISKYFSVLNGKGWRNKVNLNKAQLWLLLHLHFQCMEEIIDKDIHPNDKGQYAWSDILKLLSNFYLRFEQKMGQKDYSTDIIAGDVWKNIDTVLQYIYNNNCVQVDEYPDFIELIKNTSAPGAFGSISALLLHLNSTFLPPEYSLWKAPENSENSKNRHNLRLKCSEIFKWSQDFLIEPKKYLGTLFIQVVMSLLTENTYNCEDAKSVLSTYVDDIALQNAYNRIIYSFNPDTQKIFQRIKYTKTLGPSILDECHTLMSEYVNILQAFAKKLCISTGIEIKTDPVVKDLVTTDGLDSVNTLIKTYSDHQISPLYFKNDLHLVNYFYSNDISKSANDEIFYNVKRQIEQSYIDKVIDRIKTEVRQDPRFKMDNHVLNENGIDPKLRKKIKKKSPIDTEIERRIKQYLKGCKSEIDQKTNDQIKNENLLNSLAYCKHYMYMLINKFSHTYKPLLGLDAIANNNAEVSLCILYYRTKYLHITYPNLKSIGRFSQYPDELSQVKDAVNTVISTRLNHDFDLFEKFNKCCVTLVNNQLFKSYLQPTFAKDMIVQIERVVNEKKGDYNRQSVLFNLVDYASELGKWKSWQSLLDGLHALINKADSKLKPADGYDSDDDSKNTNFIESEAKLMMSAAIKEYKESHPDIKNGVNSQEFIFVDELLSN